MAKARKTRTLPFVVKPRLQPVLTTVGSEESGKIEIERRGYLTVAEKSWVQTLESGDETQGRLHRLAVRLGAELNMEPRAALTLISESQLNDERLLPFQEEILEILADMSSFQERRKIITATCLLVNRVDPAWDVEDTMQLHVDLLQDLADLYVEEETKSLEALEAAIPEEEAVEAELGKD